MTRRLVGAMTREDLIGYIDKVAPCGLRMAAILHVHALNSENLPARSVQVETAMKSFKNKIKKHKKEVDQVIFTQY